MSSSSPVLLPPYERESAAPSAAGGGAVLAALAVAGLLVRAEALHLPLLGAGAEVAAAARGLAEGRLGAPSGGGLLTAWVATPAVLLGVPATVAVRVVECLAGAALAPVAALLAARAGARPATRVLVGLLALLHPSVSVAAGGAAAHGLALVTLVWTAAVLRRDAPGLVAARQVGFAGVLVSLGAPHGILLGVPLLVHHARLETSPTARFAPSLAALLAFTVLPGARGNAFFAAGPGATSLALCLALGGPLVLGLWATVRGAHATSARLGIGRGLIVAVGLYLVAELALPATGEGVPLASAPLMIPLVVALGGCGMARYGARFASRVRLGTLALGALATLMLAVPAAGRLWAAGSESTAARARWLERASELAAEAAGQDGLVVFAAPQSEAERASAADGLPTGQSVASERSPEAGERGTGHLVAFDPGTLSPERTVALVAPLETFGSIQALGAGTVLFRLTVVESFGPYAVLRGHRD